MKLDRIRLVRRMEKWVVVYRGYELAQTILFHARHSEGWILISWKQFRQWGWKIGSVCQICFCLAVINLFFPKTVRRWLKKPATWTHPFNE